MTTRIDWTDSTGAASLSNLLPHPGDRLSDWLPESESIGPRIHAPSTGELYRTEYRVDDSISFEVRAIPTSQMALFLRLQLHLLRSGVCNVTRDEPSEDTLYEDCYLAPGTEPVISMTDNVNVEYTFGAKLLYDEPPVSIALRYITVTIVASECSGDPEILTCEGDVANGIMFTGTQITLPGQSKTFGPFPTQGIVDFEFWAYHQFYGIGPDPGIVAADLGGGSYTIKLDDGYAADYDIDDIVLTVTVSDTAPGPVTPFLPFPTNDNFANRIALTGVSGSVTGTNLTSTRETGEPTLSGLITPARAGNTIWYSWTAPSNGAFQFDTNATVDTYVDDTIIGIYTGVAVGSLTEVAWDDDSGTGKLSSVAFTAVSGTTYQVQVGTYQSLQEGSSITLTWGPATVPANDDFANRIVVAGASGSVVGNNLLATEETGEPTGDGQRYTLWYEWTAGANGTATFDTLSSDPARDTVLGVYTGVAVNALVEIALNDDFTGTLSQVTFAAVSGTVYKVQLSTYVGTDTGALTLAWNLV